MDTVSVSRSEANASGTDPNTLVVFELQEESISELRRLLYEKTRDAQLAAEIGTALLHENTKLSNVVQSKDAEIKALGEKVSNLESALDRQSHRYNVSSRLEQTLLHKEKSQENDSAAILSTSPLKQPPMFMQNNRMLQRLENKIAQLKADKQQLEARIQDLIAQLDKSEKSRWDTQDEMNKMKESFENIKHQMHMNQDSSRTLRELVETQKEALEDAQKIDEENKKTNAKLKADVSKLQSQLESAEGAQQEVKQLKQENTNLKKINSQSKRFEEDYQSLLSENERLSSLLKDRNDLTEGMQRLLEENKRYRREQEENQLLLEESKRTIKELKDKVEELSIDRSNGESIAESNRLHEENFKEDSDFNTKSKEQALSDLNKRLDSSKDKLKKIRCPLWPSCDKGNQCFYHHPTEVCKNLPNCPRGDACLYIHPISSPCRYGIKCTRIDCSYKHPPGRVLTPKTWRMKAKSVKSFDT